MMWILWGVYAAAAVGIINAFFRANPLGLSLWLMLLTCTIPTMLGTQLGFVKFYQAAPTFLVAWFLGSALTSVAGFITSILLFHEHPTILNIIGIGCIIFGGYLLTK